MSQGICIANSVYTVVCTLTVSYNYSLSSIKQLLREMATFKTNNYKEGSEDQNQKKNESAVFWLWMQRWISWLSTEPEETERSDGVGKTVRSIPHKRWKKYWIRAHPSVRQLICFGPSLLRSGLGWIPRRRVVHLAQLEMKNGMAPRQVISQIFSVCNW